MDFQDYLPVMASNLGEQDFMEELCKGFEILADPATGTITAASLLENAQRLGLAQELLGDAEAVQEMVRQGDYDGDGALNQHEFCILMIRLSPALISEARDWLEEAIEDELQQGFDDDDPLLLLQQQQQHDDMIDDEPMTLELLL